jgi:integrase
VASAGYRKRVSGRTGRVSYQVWWLADDGTQGATTVATKDEAVRLTAEKRLALTHDTWQGRQRGRLPFTTWAGEWWADWSADPDRSPNALATTESHLRLHLRPWFGDRPIKRIGPAEVRRWQTRLAGTVGHETLLACRSVLFRILQLAEDEDAIATNPLRKVPAPKRRADPEAVFGQARRRALTPEEAGRLLARVPVAWWDHLLTLLGTGLRFGELAGLRCRRVHLDRDPPVLQVVDVRYQAGGQFGSGFKARPKSDAGLRELPLAPTVVGAIRRQLPSGADPDALVFTGPGGGNGVPAGSRTVALQPPPDVPGCRGPRRR